MTEKIIICDVDGTLADCGHRLHHVRNKPKRWDKFFAELHNDALIEPVAEMVRSLYLSDRYEVILMSGRGEEYRAETEAWLADVGFNEWDELIMRKEKDSRGDEIVKRELYEARFPTPELKAKVVGVFDDRPKVIRMWREIGVFVFNVGSGVEF